MKLLSFLPALVGLVISCIFVPKNEVLNKTLTWKKAEVILMHDKSVREVYGIYAQVKLEHSPSLPKKL